MPKSPNELAQEIANLLVAEEHGIAMRAIEQFLPVIWSNNVKYITITDATDEWKAFALHIEDRIRNMFADVRHG